MRPQEDGYFVPLEQFLAHWQVIIAGSFRHHETAVDSFILEYSSFGSLKFCSEADLGSQYSDHCLCPKTVAPVSALLMGIDAVGWNFSYFLNEHWILVVSSSVLRKNPDLFDFHFSPIHQC